MLIIINKHIKNNKHIKINICGIVIRMMISRILIYIYNYYTEKISLKLYIVINACHTRVYVIKIKYEEKRMRHNYSMIINNKL